MSCTITHKGKKYSEEQFKEYFINNKQEFTTSIAKNKDVIDSFKRKMEGIDFVFSQSPELASVGSKAQYLQYLSTIFPNSKVKDIVYHGTNEKFDKFDKSKLGTKTINKTNKLGFYFSDKKVAAMFNSLLPKDYYNATEEKLEELYKQYSEKYGETKAKEILDELVTRSYDKSKMFDRIYLPDSNFIAAVINSKNPFIGDTDEFAGGTRGDGEEVAIKYKNLTKSNDSIILPALEDGGLGGEEFESDNYIVFEPEQIHILSSKADIQGFKEFVQGKQFQKLTAEEKAKTIEQVTKEHSKLNQESGSLSTISKSKIDNLQNTVEYQLLNEQDENLDKKVGQSYVFLSEKDAERFTYLVEKNKKFPKEFKVTKKITRYERSSKNPLKYDGYNEYVDVYYIKSNNNKKSNLYDIVIEETGEAIASKVRVLASSKDVKSEIAKKYGLEHTPTTIFSANRSIAFALYRQKPSKVKYIAQAKKYLYDAIKFLNPEETSLKINLGKIEELLNNFPEEMWDYINTTYSPEESTNINASISLQNEIKFNLPKLGFIQELEKITGLKLLGTSFKNYDRSGRLAKVFKYSKINGEWGDTITIDNSMTTKELKSSIKYYLSTKNIFKQSSEEENVRKYAEHKGIDYNKLRELVFGDIDKALDNIAYNYTDNSDTIELSKWRESIKNYDWQIVELFSKPYENFQNTVKERIIDKFKDKKLSNGISHLEYFFNSGTFNWLNINFNNISGQYYMADMETEANVGVETKMGGIINPFEMKVYQKPKVGENFLQEKEVFNRLAAILHEPLHALHALSYGTKEELELRKAFDNLYNTDFGKEMMYQVFGSDYNQGQQVSYDTLYKEFTAFTTQLMLYPKQWIKNTDLRSNDIYEFIEKIQTLQDKTYEEIVKVQQKIGVTEKIITEEEKIKLTFLEKLYNYLVKALNKIIPLSKKFTNLIADSKLVEKKVIEDLFGTVEETVTKTLKLPENVKKSKEEFLQAMDELKSAINILMQIDGKLFSSENINNFFTSNRFNQESKVVPIDPNMVDNNEIQYSKISSQESKSKIEKLFNNQTNEVSNVKPDVILPIGTSGSGKSTFIKSLPQENLVIIEPDAMRVEFTGDINNKSKDKEIYIESANRAIKAIKQGKQVVFDTTNLTKEKRRPFIEAIRKEFPNANIQYKLMELNPELAKQRIKNRLKTNPPVEKFDGFWNRSQVANQTNKVFLFGDNTNDRTVTNYVPSMTQAVIRGLPNAIGIDTKKDRGTSINSYLTDNDLEWFKGHVDTQIQKAKDSGKTIVVPADGIGTGKAMLKEKAPKLFKYLQEKLRELELTQGANVSDATIDRHAESYKQMLEDIKDEGITNYDDNQQFQNLTDKEESEYYSEYNKNDENSNNLQSTESILETNPKLKKFIEDITDEDGSISLFKYNKIINDKEKFGNLPVMKTITKLNNILKNAVNRLWDNRINAENNLKIKFVESLEDEDAVAQFLRKENEIHISKNIFLNILDKDFKDYLEFYTGYLLNHELIHYLTPQSLSIKPQFIDRLLLNEKSDMYLKNLYEREFVKNIKNLYNFSISQLEDLSDYGFTNLAEFVTEAMSNPRFQVKLSTIKYKNENKSLWKKFIKILSDYLSSITGNSIEDTVLEAVISEVTNYITENSNIERTYKTKINNSGDTQFYFVFNKNSEIGIEQEEINNYDNSDNENFEFNEDLTGNEYIENIDNKYLIKFEELLNKGVITQICN